MRVLAAAPAIEWILDTRPHADHLSQWNRPFSAGDTFKLGEIDGRILFSPGHTLASITYVIEPPSSTIRC